MSDLFRFLIGLMQQNNRLNQNTHKTKHSCFLRKFGSRFKHIEIKFLFLLLARNHGEINEIRWGEKGGRKILNVTMFLWLPCQGKKERNISVYSALQLAMCTNLFCCILNEQTFAGNRLLAWSGTRSLYYCLPGLSYWEDPTWLSGKMLPASAVLRSVTSNEGLV